MAPFSGRLAFVRVKLRLNRTSGSSSKATAFQELLDLLIGYNRIMDRRGCEMAGEAWGKGREGHRYFTFWGRSEVGLVRAFSILGEHGDGQA